VARRSFHPARDSQLDVDATREAGALGEKRTLALGVSMRVRRLGRPSSDVRRACGPAAA